MFERHCFFVATQRMGGSPAVLSEAMSELEARRRLDTMSADDRSASCVISAPVVVDESAVYDALIRDYTRRIEELKAIAAKK